MHEALIERMIPTYLTIEVNVADVVPATPGVMTQRATESIEERHGPDGSWV